MAKKKKKTTRKRPRAKSTRKNPPMKRVKRSTGWMKATAVKIVKRGGVTQVLVRKKGKR